MAVTIESVTIGTLEKRLVLANSQWAAKLTIGNDWTTIRIGWRYTFDNTGANLGAAKFYVGMLSNPVPGLTNGPLNATCSHFVGMFPNSSNWSYLNSTPPNARYSRGSVDSAFKKIGSTTTIGTNANESLVQISATPSTQRPIAMIEITKGSPNYSVRSAGNQSGYTPDKSYATLYNNFANPSWATAVANMTLGTSSNIGSVAADEADGILNAICFAWDRLTPRCYISEVLFARMA